VVDFMEEIRKKILWVLTCVFVVVNVFLLNVIAHEIGHYVGADYYGLKPRIDYEFENFVDLSFSVKSVSVASTVFINDGDDSKIFLIAVMGPFINLVLGVFLISLFFVFKLKIRELFLIGGVVSLVSFIMNILPFEGSDGSLVLRIILGN
jgi:Zn-dependent protease